MEPTFATSRFAVFDDVLSSEAQQNAWSYALAKELRAVHDRGIRAVWRIPDDGSPFQSDAIVSTALRDLVQARGLPEAALAVATDSAGTAIDPVIQAARAAAGGGELVGSEGADWIGLLAFLQAYPVASGLSWHRDAGIYSGAFIYYLHPEWSEQWGGELLVSDEDAPSKAMPFSPTSFGRAYGPDSTTRGIGHFIAPRPNRLVLLRGGTPHMISKVTIAAGNHTRLSLSGFFVRPAGIDPIVAEAKRLFEQR